jgi:hypothetical protein
VGVATNRRCSVGLSFNDAIGGSAMIYVDSMICFPHKMTLICLGVSGMLVRLPSKKCEIIYGENIQILTCPIDNNSLCSSISGCGKV